MMDLAEFTWGRYNGGITAQAGTYVNFRTMCYFQQASDGALPSDGTFCFISTNATLTATQIASTVNAVLGTAYVAGSFHSCVGGDAAPSPGTGADDA